MAVDAPAPLPQRWTVSASMELEPATVAARLGLALLLGAAIGWDRQRAGKAAGLRTHMLISLGACLFVLVQLGLGPQADALSRTIQGIATGIGFLGGGVILHHANSDEKGKRISGLTSAAAIWATAALGIAAACVLWRTALLAAGAALITLVLVKGAETTLFKPDTDDDQT